MTQLSEAEHIAVLKEMLQNSLDLPAMSAYFHNNLGKALIRPSDTVQNKHLSKLVAGAVTILTGRPCKLAFPSFMHLPKYDLFHGPIRLPNGVATVFYFQKLERGVITLIGENQSVAYLALSRSSKD